ncbi:unnamed protein product, partial [Closterium sp. Naga37s-1]
VMVTKQRDDLRQQLPALRKLDDMLLEMLDECNSTEYWYTQERPDPVANGAVDAHKAAGSSSRRNPRHRDGCTCADCQADAEDDDGYGGGGKKGSKARGGAAAAARSSGGGGGGGGVMRESKTGKWWRPVPRVPVCGLSEALRKHLEHQMEKAAQIVKLAMAINTQALEDMAVPAAYTDNLPKVPLGGNGGCCYFLVASKAINTQALEDMAVPAAYTDNLPKVGYCVHACVAIVLSLLLLFFDLPSLSRPLSRFIILPSRPCPGHAVPSISPLQPFPPLACHPTTPLHNPLPGPKPSLHHSQPCPPHPTLLLSPISTHPLQSGRAALGDQIYSVIMSSSFSVDRVLDTVDLTNEHAALKLACRLLIGAGGTGRSDILGDNEQQLQCGPGVGHSGPHNEHAALKLACRLDGRCVHWRKMAPPPPTSSLRLLPPPLLPPHPCQQPRSHPPVFPPHSYLLALLVPLSHQVPPADAFNERALLELWSAGERCVKFEENANRAEACLRSHQDAAPHCPKPLSTPPKSSTTRSVHQRHACCCVALHHCGYPALQ